QISEFHRGRPVAAARCGVYGADAAGRRRRGALRARVACQRSGQRLTSSRVHLVLFGRARSRDNNSWEGDMKRLVLLLVTLIFSALALAAVNINTATKEELDALPGIGPVKAQAIVDYRAKNGPFKTPEDIMKVSGIKEGEFSKLKGLISVSGASTPVAGPARTETKAAAPAMAPAPSTPAPAPPPKTAAPAAAPAPAVPSAAPAAKDKSTAAKDASTAAKDEKMSKADKAETDKAAKAKAKEDAATEAKAKKEAKAAEDKAKKEAKATEAKN